ncbi:MAG: hypothetical protein VXW24_04175 [Bacteroidota bacterium]|nr:hypothetical protein [Bacteroidota bacterium]
MPNEEEYYHQALERKLERMQLSPSEVKRALQESDDFVDGLDEVFDEMFPPTNNKPVDDSDADQFQLGAIL